MIFSQIWWVRQLRPYLNFSRHIWLSRWNWSPPSVIHFTGRMQENNKPRMQLRLVIIINSIPRTNGPDTYSIQSCIIQMNFTKIAVAFGELPYGSLLYQKFLEKFPFQWADLLKLLMNERNGSSRLYLLGQLTCIPDFLIWKQSWKSLKEKDFLFCYSG